MTTKYHEHINQSQLPTYHRVSRLEEMIASEREARRGFRPGEHNYRVATANIEMLEEALDRAKRGERHRAEIQRRRDAEAAAKAKARQDEAEAALRNELHLRFKAGNPDATDADFEAAYPAMKAAEQARRADEAMAHVRRTVRPL